MTFLRTDSLLSDTDLSAKRRLPYCLFPFRTETNKFVLGKVCF
jgi:hypothetical protein